MIGMGGIKEIPLSIKVVQLLVVSLIFKMLLICERWGMCGGWGCVGDWVGVSDGGANL